MTTTGYIEVFLENGKRVLSEPGTAKDVLYHCLKGKLLATCDREIVMTNLYYFIIKFCTITLVYSFPKTIKSLKRDTEFKIVNNPKLQDGKIIVLVTIKIMTGP